MLSITLILYPFAFFQKLLFSFPINWHFLHAYIDSFQGCFKDRTEPGTFDCRCFSVFKLLMRPLFLLIFGLTLSMMFFYYAAIFLVIILIAVINIQPFKKAAVHFPSTDMIFIILLDVYYTAALRRDVAEDVYSHFMLVVISSSPNYIHNFTHNFLVCIKNQVDFDSGTLTNK